MRRRAISTSFHIAAAFGLLSCGTKTRESSRSSEAEFKVALLTPGPISDQSWNGGAYAGLLRIRDSLGAQISHIQTKTPAEFEENFRNYGRRGYAIVFGHGFEFQDAARRVAPSYPNTVYVVSSTMLASGNAVGMQFSFDQPSYIAGLIAGAITKSGVIGEIGGTELPPVKAGFQAFAEGAAHTRPGVKVLTSYVGNWDDVAAGKEQALAQIAQHADVIFQNADAAGLGVFQAARASHDVLVFGSNGDQNAVAPDVIIGSVVIDLPHAFLTVARKVREGKRQSGTISLGAETDVVRLTLNPVLLNRIPATVRASADSAWLEMRAGRRMPASSVTRQ